MVRENFLRCHVEAILGRTHVPRQVWQRWRLVSNQVCIRLRWLLIMLTLFVVGLAEDSLRVIPGQVVILRPGQMCVRWCARKHLMGHFFELEPLRKSLSSVNHDLSLLVLLDSSDVSCAINDFLGEEGRATLTLRRHCALLGLLL